MQELGVSMLQFLFASPFFAAVFTCVLCSGVGSPLTAVSLGLYLLQRGVPPTVTLLLC